MLASLCASMQDDCVEKHIMDGLVGVRETDCHAYGGLKENGKRKREVFSYLKMHTCK